MNLFFESNGMYDACLHVVSLQGQSVSVASRARIYFIMLNTTA